MNREIKFRAWDKLKGMVNVTLLPLPQPNGKEDRPLMQYTGLKDKNGTEIYEGDVVRMTNNFKGEIVGEIVYEKCSFEVMDGERDSFTIDWTDKAERLEVIGNIYENPNLLEDE